ncbi:MAG: tetratricopeptide repeat protein [Candidatus Omnitrophica bacterium]|nr:tetratricopeptide repeat protein [Candidatus Omnitrophota bacterium]
MSRARRAGFITLFAVLAVFLTAFYRFSHRADIAYSKGRDYSSKGDFEKAAPLYEETLDAEPSRVEARLSLAEILSWQGRYDESIAQYQKVLDAEPDNERARQKLAGVYLWAGRLQEAEDAFKNLLKDHPGDAEIRASLGEVLIRRKRYDEAIETLEQGLSVKPDANLEFLRAEALYFSGKSGPAEEAMRRALEEDPGNSKAKALLAEMAANGGRTEEARALYGDLLANGKKWSAASRNILKRNIAKTYLMDREYEKAEVLLKEVLAENPSDTAAKLMLARAYHYSGKTEESKELAEALLKEID